MEEWSLWIDDKSHLETNATGLSATYVALTKYCDELYVGLIDD